MKASPVPARRTTGIDLAPCLPDTAMALPRRMRVIFAILLRAGGQFVTAERIADALYCDDPDGGPLDAAGNVHTYVWHMRRRIAGTGWRISSSRFDGYRLVRHGANRNSARWRAVIEYRTHDGVRRHEHFLEEIADLDRIVEAGPHWDTIVTITMALSSPVEKSGMTIEEAAEL